MGWEIHISRHMLHWQSERCPIREAELEDLIRSEDDLNFRPDRSGLYGADRAEPGWFTWDPPDGIGSWFMYMSGRISTKHPEDATIRRMIAIAAMLDAWVSADDPQFHTPGDTGEILTREPSRDEVIRTANCSITREIVHAGFSPGGITPDEWRALPAVHPDILMVNEIPAWLPSGMKHVRCAPVPAWVGHPAGTPVALFYDDGRIEVENPDHSTLLRMLTLADSLGAVVIDSQDRRVAANGILPPLNW